jgi:8-oxo-dGTP pyrophosphatase MutT (NUDIX family)
VVAELDDSQAPPRPWRLSARLLLLDQGERLLLVRARDPDDPAGGEWWEIPGGGVERGEDTVAAAVRETAEETGYLIGRRRVGPVCWTGDVTYRWDGRRCWASLAVHLARVRRPLRRRIVPTEDRAHRMDIRWVPIARVIDERDRYFPASLPKDLPRILAGEIVDAGFTVWS